MRPILVCLVAALVGCGEDSEPARREYKRLHGHDAASSGRDRASERRDVIVGLAARREIELEVRDLDLTAIGRHESEP